jgi:hypothetical protein
MESWQKTSLAELARLFQGFDDVVPSGFVSRLVAVAAFFVCQLTAVDRGIAWEVKSQADLVTMDLDHAYQAQGVVRVADDDFFADASCQCEHGFILVSIGRQRGTSIRT